MEFVGLVQGLQVYLGFLFWEEEKTPGRENKSLGIFFFRAIGMSWKTWTGTKLHFPLVRINFSLDKNQQFGTKTRLVLLGRSIQPGGSAGDGNALLSIRQCGLGTPKRSPVPEPERGCQPPAWTGTVPQGHQNGASPAPLQQTGHKVLLIDAVPQNR